MSERKEGGGFGALGSGFVTAVALAVQTGLAGIVGIIVARDFGRTAQTDGFFAAYAVFVVMLLAANGIRVIVLPPLARARDENQLGSEVAAYAVMLAAFVVPLVLIAFLAAHPFAWVLTGGGHEPTIHAAAEVLPWMMLAAVLQLYAGLAASSLAALNDYTTPAIGYVLGSSVGLVFILARINADGIQAVARGMALNGLIAASFPLAALARRAFAQKMPARDPPGQRLVPGTRRRDRTRRCAPLRPPGDLSDLRPAGGPRRGRRGDQLRLRLSDRVGRGCGDRLVARPRHLRAARRGAGPRTGSLATSCRPPGSPSL